jgi:transposase-like protein
MDIQLKRRPRLSGREKARLLETYEKSSMTQREFAAAYGIGYSTLTKWLRDSRQLNSPKSGRNHFIEISHADVFGGVTEKRFTLESPSGWRIHLPQQADIQFTQQLMELCSR